MARTLSIIGDRWTLLILRDCFLQIRRFDDFQARLGIGRPILADRLQKLVDAFVLTKVAYQEKPLRYEYQLTDKGRDLFPVIMAIVHWGDVHMAGRAGPPLVFHHADCGHTFDPVQVCSACREKLDVQGVRVTLGPGAPRSAAGRSIDARAELPKATRRRPRKPARAPAAKSRK